MAKNKNTYHASGSLKAYHALNHKVSYLLGLLLFTFISGILAYPEQFKFYDDALSYLGEIHPINGKSNLLSFVIFTSGMIGCSLLSFNISIDTKGTWAHILFKIAGIGFIFIAVPTDLFNIIHSLGGALAIGSLWLFSTLTLNKLYNKANRFKILFFQLILQGTVLPYAFLYFSGSPARQYAQKFAIIGLMLILKICIKEYMYMLKREDASTNAVEDENNSHACMQ